MKYKGNINDRWYTAKKKINIGDIVVKLWINYCRPTESKDKNIYLIALTNAKKGQQCLVHHIDSNEIYKN